MQQKQSQPLKVHAANNAAKLGLDSSPANRAILNTTSHQQQRLNARLEFADALPPVKANQHAVATRYLAGNGEW